MSNGFLSNERMLPGLLRTLEHPFTPHSNLIFIEHNNYCFKILLIVSTKERTSEGLGRPLIIRRSIAFSTFSLKAKDTLGKDKYTFVIA